MIFAQKLHKEKADGGQEASGAAGRGFEVPVRAGYADRSKDEECQKSGICLFRGSKHTI